MSIITVIHIFWLEDDVVQLDWLSRLDYLAQRDWLFFEGQLYLNYQ